MLTPICVEVEVQIPTNLATAQEEHNAKSDQPVEIPEQSIVDLIQPIGESSIMLIYDNEDFPLHGEEKISARE